MSLDLGGGSFTPFVRFKPSINAWEKSDDADGKAVEFAFDSPAVIDIELIKLGWLLLAEGVCEYVAWPDNKRIAKPDDREWKSSATVHFFSKALFGDTNPVRELRTSQAGTIEFVKKLYNECEPRFGKGEVPVVKITGAKAEKFGKGTTRIPLFEIVKFVARPADLSGGESAAEPAAQSAPPKQAEAAPAPQAAEAKADADEF